MLRTEKTTILFEAGLPVSVLKSRLASEGIALSDVAAVVISHEHSDHCLAAADLTRMFGIPVVAGVDVLRACGLLESETARFLDPTVPSIFGDVEVSAFPTAHDAACPVGFLVRAGEKSIAIATDTGTATPAMLDAVSVADLVVLEANHDVEMLRRGRYPYHLQRRVAGPLGHLSNDQAAGILTRCVTRPSVDIWLAHLSKDNNTPELALKTVRRALKVAGVGASADVVRRDRPSLRWTGSSRPQQLSLFGAEVA